jgi:L-tyrosine isonitrile synthase
MLLLPPIESPSVPYWDDVSQTAPLARRILDVVYELRNVIDCPLTGQQHLTGGDNYQVARIDRFIARGEPIHFVLPAFPAKSPNPEKTLGRLPDYGEVLALLGLNGL